MATFKSISQFNENLWTRIILKLAIPEMHMQVGQMEAQVAHFAHPKNDNTIDYVII